MSDSFTLHHGDCLEILATLPDCSVDAVVTDPPYGLGSAPDPVKVMTAWATQGYFEVQGKGFMGKNWDAFVPQPVIWKEVFRVLKPGGHLLAFSGTRTQDWMAMSIRFAGFEIRDMIAWVYGSGFPKSRAIDKAIDAEGGGDGMPENDRKAFAAELRDKREAAGVSRQELALWFPKYTENTKNWERQDAGFRIPSEPDYRILVERLGVSESWRLRVRAEDKRRLVSEELQDRREDDTVLGLGHSGKKWEPTTEAAQQWAGWGTALKPALEPITLARKPFTDTVAANVLKHGTGAINIDECRVDAKGDKLCVGNNNSATDLTGMHEGWTRPWMKDESARLAAAERSKSATQKAEALGRWPANFTHDGSDEVTALFPSTSSGAMKAGTVRRDQENTSSVAYGVFGGNATNADTYGDSGSAARFFYCAKASKKDRNEGCEELDKKISARSCQAQAEAKRGNVVECEGGAFNKARLALNHHPTVKPTELMRYLCRLVTPPGGLILDPFMGSGSTGKAAMLEGFRFIGIEQEAEYLEIAKVRIAHAVGKTSGMLSFD